MNTRLTIVLPVINEGKNIESVVQEIEKNIRVPKELLIVYDFAGDDTIPVVRKIQKKNKQVMLVRGGGGLVAAIQTGLKKARGDYIVIMPADLADDPRVINRMVTKAKEGYDVVCATRYSRGGKKIGGGLVKTTLSRIAGVLTPVLLGIPTTDLTNGFKLYTKKVIRDIPITSTGGWEFAAELTIKAHHMGFRITQVPAIWKNRVYGRSKFRLLMWLPKYVYWYVWGIAKRIGV